MLLRNSLLIAGLASLVACNPSTSNGNNDGGTDGGSSSTRTDGGSTASDGGSQTDGGTTTGPRTVTIAQARSATPCTDYIKLQGVVITSIENKYQGDDGDWGGQFWVTDPANPLLGIYVDKYFLDSEGAYEPTVGDVVDLEGYVQRIRNFDDREANRLVFKSQYGCSTKPNDGQLRITKKTPMTPLEDNVAPPDFGAAQDGEEKANPEYLGGRVYVMGPLELTNAMPLAFRNLSVNSDGGVYFGFEVTGGILVSNYKTFGTTRDGGAERCDWRAIASDGGPVKFPNGIRGVWDTYSHAPCETMYSDGGCFRSKGSVPGTDQNYTHILYPQDCATDLPGEVQ